MSQSKRKLKRELKKLRTLQCTLSDQQDHEMRDIASIIERDFSSELQDVIDGSSKKENGKSKVLRAIWEQDVIKTGRSFGMIKGEIVRNFLKSARKK